MYYITYGHRHRYRYPPIFIINTWAMTIKLLHSTHLKRGCVCVCVRIVLKVKCSSQKDWICTCNCKCFSRTRHCASLLHTMQSLHLPPLPHILSILHSRMKRAICIVCVCVKHVSWAFLKVFYGCFSHAVEVMRTLHPSGHCVRARVCMNVCDPRSSKELHRSQVKSRAHPRLDFLDQ